VVKKRVGLGNTYIGNEVAATGKRSISGFSGEEMKGEVREWGVIRRDLGHEEKGGWEDVIFS